MPAINAHGAHAGTGPSADVSTAVAIIPLTSKIVLPSNQHWKFRVTLRGESHIDFVTQIYKMFLQSKSPPPLPLKKLSTSSKKNSINFQKFAEILKSSQ